MAQLINAAGAVITPPSLGPARATVITDASFCPNSKAAGWAAWVTVNPPQGQVYRVKRSGNFHRKIRNATEAEKYAAFNGIWLAYQEGCRRILAQTDCLSVVQEGWRAGYPYIAETHWPDAEIEWRHVKGHTRHEQARYFVNRWCDTEAKAMMNKQRNVYGYTPPKRKRRRK